MEHTEKKIYLAGMNKLYDDAKKADGTLLWARVAESAEQEPSNISSYRTGTRNFKESIKRSIAEFFGKTYVEVLLIGMKELGIAPSSAPRQTPSDSATLMHQNVVKNFKQKTLAKEINEKLVVLEGKDPDLLNEINDYIDMKLKHTIHRQEEAWPGSRTTKKLNGNG